MVCDEPGPWLCKRARAFAERLDVPLAIVDKRRPKPNSSENYEHHRRHRRKDVLIVDDMIDTAGTLVNAATAVIERGAQSVAGVCNPRGAQRPGHRTHQRLAPVRGGGTGYHPPHRGRKR